jgi:hypothetical protein
MVYDGTLSNIYLSGGLTTSVVLPTLSYTPTASTQFGNSFIGNLADVRVSNVARYTGSTYTVPNVADGSGPFVTDRNTLLLLKSLGGQTGTTLEVQGRGLNAVSLGATRSVQSYPPAPMSSYLLDTTSNASVTYGQGKYVASASSEYAGGGYEAWKAFNKNSTGSTNFACVAGVYSTSSPYSYTGSVRTVDVLGNSYAGEWFQIQLPVSIILSSYTLVEYAYNSVLTTFSVVGSRDGINWTLVDYRSGVTSWSGVPASLTFTASATQAYNYFRLIGQNTNGSLTYLNAVQWTLNGTEESLCITSDAKVGVGIANPQRALEVAGDLVVSGTISGGAGMGSFRNRIINGDMRIAQRGTSFTTTTASATYTVDRWLLFTAGTTLTEQRTLTASDSPYQMGLANSVRMTSTPGTAVTAYEVIHRIEGYNLADFNWGTSFGQPATLSFWFRSLCTQGSTFSFAIRTGNAVYSYVNQFTYNTPGSWQYYTFTIPPPPNGYNSDISVTTATAIAVEIGSYHVATVLAGDPNTWVTGNRVMVKGVTNVLATPGNFIELTGVQLERGTVATPFEVRPFAQELALCQRYFYRWVSTSTFGVLGYATALNTTAALLQVPFPVQMRSNTTSTNFTSSAVGSFATQGAAFGALSAIASTVDGNSLNMGTVLLTFATATAGQTVQVRANGSSTAFVAFNVEL